jgi:hypothetical protein
MDIHNVAEFLRMIKEINDNGDDWDNISKDLAREKIQKYRKKYPESEEDGADSSLYNPNAPEHIRSPVRHNFEEEISANSEEDIRKFLSYIITRKKNQVLESPVEDKTDIFITDHDAPLVWQIFHNTDWGGDVNEKKQNAKIIIIKSIYRLYSAMIQVTANRTEQNIKYLFSLINIYAVISNSFELSMFQQSPLYTENEHMPTRYFFDNSLRNCQKIKRFDAIQIAVPVRIENAIKELCQDSLLYKEIKDIFLNLQDYIIEFINNSERDYINANKLEKNNDKEEDNEGGREELTPEEYLQAKISSEILTKEIINSVISKKTFFKPENGVAEEDVIRARSANIIKNIQFFLKEYFSELEREFQNYIKGKASNSQQLIGLMNDFYNSAETEDFINLSFKIAILVLAVGSEGGVNFSYSYTEFVDNLRYKNSFRINTEDGRALSIPVTPLLKMLETAKSEAFVYYEEDKHLINPEKVDPTELNMKDLIGVKTLYSKYNKLAEFYKKLDERDAKNRRDIINTETKQGLIDACNDYEINSDEDVFEDSKKKIAEDVASFLREPGHLTQGDFVIDKKLSVFDKKWVPFELNADSWERILFLYPYGSFVSSQNIGSNANDFVLYEIKQSSGPADVSLSSVRSGEFFDGGDVERLINFSRASEDLKEYLKEMQKQSEISPAQQKKQFLVDNIETLFVDIGYKIINRVSIECFNAIFSSKLDINKIQHISGFNILLSYILQENKYYTSKGESVAANRDKQVFIRLHQNLKTNFIKKFIKQGLKPSEANMIYSEFLEQNDIVRTLLRLQKMKKVFKKEEEKKTGKKKKASASSKKVNSFAAVDNDPSLDLDAERYGFNGFEKSRYASFNPEQRKIYDLISSISDKAFLLLYMHEALSSNLLNDYISKNAGTDVADEFIEHKLEEIYNNISIKTTSSYARKNARKRVIGSRALARPIEDEIREELGYESIGKRRVDTIRRMSDYYLKQSEFFNRKGEQLEYSKLQKRATATNNLQKILFKYANTFYEIFYNDFCNKLEKLSTRVRAKEKEYIFTNYIQFVKKESYRVSSRMKRHVSDLFLEEFREEIEKFFNMKEILEGNQRILEILTSMQKNPSKEIRNELQHHKDNFYKRTKLLWETGASSLEEKYKIAFETPEEADGDLYDNEGEKIKTISGNLHFSQEDFDRADKSEQPRSTEKLDFRSRYSADDLDDLDTASESEVGKIDPDVEDNSLDSFEKELPEKPRLLKPPKQKSQKAPDSVSTPAPETLKESREPRIKIKFKKKDNKFYEIVNNTPDNFSELISIMDEFIPYSKEYLGYDKPVKVVLDYPHDYKDPFAPTGQYDPRTSTVVVFVQGRHPKDILRSLSHELTHHHQNCKGMFVPNLIGDGAVEGYAQKNPHLRKMEQEATNLMLRDFEDKRRKKNGR